MFWLGQSAHSLGKGEGLTTRPQGPHWATVWGQGPSTRPGNKLQMGINTWEYQSNQPRELVWGSGRAMGWGLLLRVESGANKQGQGVPITAMLGSPKAQGPTQCLNQQHNGLVGEEPHRNNVNNGLKVTLGWGWEGCMGKEGCGGVALHSGLLQGINNPNNQMYNHHQCQNFPQTNEG